jgi:uncharacterized membrane protein
MQAIRNGMTSSKKDRHSAGHPPEIFFLAIAAFFGFLMVVVVPPFQAPDERAHYYRAYDIADFKWIAQKSGRTIGEELPQSLSRIADELTGDIPFNPQRKISIQKIIDYLSIPLNESVKKFVSFQNTALSSPMVHLPQALGIATGKIFRLPPLVLFYLARLFNLMIWISLIFYAIRIAPIGKWLFGLLALLPMSVFLAASLSADPLTNGLSLLFIAYILKQTLMDRAIPMRSSNLMVLLILLSLNALTKQAYFFMPFLFLLIPAERLKNTKKYATIFAGLVSVFFFTGSIWFSAMSKIYVPFQAGISPWDQLQYIFHHPVAYILMIIQSLIAHGFYIRSFIGNLGWLDTPLPLVIYLSYPLFLIASSLLDDPNQLSLTIKQRAGLLLIFTFGFLLIPTLLYIAWEPVGFDSISGIQGRYFSPIAPLFFLVFQKGFPYAPSTQLKNKVFAWYAIVCLTCSVYRLISRYYI